METGSKPDFCLSLAYAVCMDDIKKEKRENDRYWRVARVQEGGMEVSKLQQLSSRKLY